MSAMKSVSSGVNLVYIGFYLIVFGLIALLLGAGLVAAGSQVGLILLATAPLMLIVGSVLGLVGRLQCLSVPDAVQATGIIYTAVVCDVLVTLFAVASWFVALPDGVDSVHALLSLLASVLFVIFLKRVAVHIKDDQSKKRAGLFLKLSIATFVVPVVGLMVAVMIFPPLLIVVSIMVFIMAIVMLCLYVRLLTGLRVSLRAA